MGTDWRWARGHAHGQKRGRERAGSVDHVRGTGSRLCALTRQRLYQSVRYRGKNVREEERAGWQQRGALLMNHAGPEHACRWQRACVWSVMPETWVSSSYERSGASTRPDSTPAICTNNTNKPTPYKRPQACKPPPPPSPARYTL